MTSGAIASLKATGKMQWAEYSGNFSEFDGIEISMVREVDGVCEVVYNSYEADYIGLYGHLRPTEHSRGVECIGDFLPEVNWDEATALAKAFAESVGLELLT